jgi:predicted RNA binding protein YcfA (HicA-like mRNA interferase family)
MPRLGPIKRKQLIKYLRQLGFDGPYGRGGKHDVMEKGNHTLTIPNPHSADIGINLLRKILKQAGIDEDTWKNL